VQEVRYQSLWTVGNILGEHDAHDTHLLLKMKRQLLAQGLWPTLLHAIGQVGGKDAYQCLTL
jgi:hypothetical protein